MRVIQEWVTLHGFHTAVDGDFGPATEACVKGFQKKNTLGVTGVVNNATFQALIAPMKRAMAPIQPGNRTLGQLVVAYAKQHLKEHPREVGGQNRGPWVRLYMGGHQGTDWPWCAGFVCYVLKQACKALGVSMPITASYSCDYLAASAKQKKRFLREPKTAAERTTKIKPGSVFLCRRTSTDWTHTGIVVQADSEVFATIEGNTNDEGTREGYEVCSRTRGYKSRDFILI